MRAFVPSKKSVLGTAVHPDGGVMFRADPPWWEMTARRTSPTLVPAGFEICRLAVDVAAAADPRTPSTVPEPLVSIVQVADWVPLSFPAASTALTEKVWLPSASEL